MDAIVLILLKMKIPNLSKILTDFSLEVACFSRASYNTPYSAT